MHFNMTINTDVISVCVTAVAANEMPQSQVHTGEESTLQETSQGSSDITSSETYVAKYIHALDPLLVESILIPVRIKV